MIVYAGDLLVLEQVRQLYRSLPAALVVNASLAILTVIMLAPVASDVLRYAWLGVMAAVLLGRAVLAFRWLRAGSQTDSARPWLLQFRGTAMATGLCWGFGSVLLFPAEHVTYQIFLALILAGICAGAVTTMAIDRLTAFGMVLPTALPGIARLAVEGGQIPVVMTVMALLFVLFLVSSIQRIGRAFEENLRLRGEAAAREEALLQSSAQLREAMQRAEVASRAKSEFLSSMSHELRTPLNAVLGYAQLFAGDDRLPQDARENALEIRRAGEKLLGLVDGMIELARIEAGGIELNVKSVSTVAVAQESLALVRDLASERRIELRDRVCKHEAVNVLADHRLLRQVLVNLLSNAIKFNRPAGIVSMSCQVHGEAIRIGVADTGYGIEPNKQERVFDVFDRLGEERGLVEGVGAGLALCKRLVEAMNGRIWFDSEPGVGSRFWVELPAADSVLRHSQT